MRAGRGCWCEIGDGYVLVGNIKLDFWEGSKGQGKIGALATIRQSRDRGNERENVIKRELKPDQTRQDRAGRGEARAGQAKARRQCREPDRTAPDHQTKPPGQSGPEAAGRGRREARGRGKRRGVRPRAPRGRAGGGRIRAGTRMGMGTSSCCSGGRAQGGWDGMDARWGPMGDGGRG